MFTSESLSLFRGIVSKFHIFVDNNCLHFCIFQMHCYLLLFTCKWKLWTNTVKPWLSGLVGTWVILIVQIIEDVNIIWCKHFWKQNILKQCFKHTFGRINELLIASLFWKTFLKKMGPGKQVQIIQIRIIKVWLYSANFITGRSCLVVLKYSLCNSLILVSNI